MSNLVSKQNNDIELFELFETLWNGKWLISAFVAVAAVLGGVFLALQVPVYESKVSYSVESIPPFLKSDEVETDFQKRIYSKSVFEDWKKTNGDVLLKFDDFSDTEVVDGYTLFKSEQKRLIISKDPVPLFIVKTNKLQILDEFYNYAVYINGTLKDDYVARSKEEQKIFKTNLRELGPAASVDADIFEKGLALDRYIVSAETGANVMNIKHPTIPKKKSPRIRLIIAISVCFGAFLGICFILVLNAIKIKSEQIAKL